MAGLAGRQRRVGGVHNLTHTLATEWTRLGVRVNCLVPGVTREMVPDLLKTPEAPDRDAVLRRIPAGRLATDGELGKALIYLVRPEASFISGEILRVDGAWDVWGRYYAVDPHVVEEVSDGEQCVGCESPPGRWPSSPGQVVVSAWNLPGPSAEHGATSIIRWSSPSWAVRPSASYRPPGTAPPL